jgi:hypothetical protein
MLAMVQSRMKAMRASAARSTNGSPLTSTAARWIVPPVKDHGDSPGQKYRKNGLSGATALASRMNSSALSVRSTVR